MLSKYLPRVAFIAGFSAILIAYQSQNPGQLQYRASLAVLKAVSLLPDAEDPTNYTKLGSTTASVTTIEISEGTEIAKK